MIVILGICVIVLILILTYTDIKATKDDGHTDKVVEAPKKQESTIQISINLYDKHSPLEGACYQVPLSHASFYIPNFKDTLVYNNSNFIVREVKKDFNTNNVIITAYKA